jgi:hypothetical protein
MIEGFNALPAELLNQNIVCNLTQDPSAKRNALPTELLNPPLFLRVQMYDNFILNQKNGTVFNKQCPIFHDKINRPMCKLIYN